MAKKSDISVSAILGVIHSSRSCQRLVAADLGISEKELGDILGSLLAKPAVMYIDGGSRGNPGDAASGIVIDYQGKRHGYYYCIGTATNNEAEYSALVKGLALLKIQRISSVAVYTDSELLSRQIGGSYKVKSPLLKPLYAKALKLIAGLDSFSINHVRRENNKDADRLVNIALDTRQDGEMELSAALHFS